VRLLAMTLENALLARQPGWLVDLDPQSLWSARLLLGEGGELLGANHSTMTLLGGGAALAIRLLVPSSRAAEGCPGGVPEAGPRGGRRWPIVSVSDRNISARRPHAPPGRGQPPARVHAWHWPSSGIPR